MSTASDWTREPLQNTAGAADTWNPDDYDFIPLAAAPDADAIEREAESREFKDVEPGDHELVVVGFLARPETRLQTGFLRGQQVSWESDMIKVRFAKTTDRQATIIDTFFLPPRDPRQQEAYLYSTKDQGSDNQGFASKKFGHFISRLGFPFAPGAPLPAEACRISNWVGRRVHAFVAVERVGKDGPRMNQQTGMPYPPRTQVKLFSYRPAANAGGQAAVQPRQVSAQTQETGYPTVREAGHAAREMREANAFASNGLDDI